MQNGAQNPQPVFVLGPGGRLLGFVRVSVGGRTFDVPVQAMTFEKDSEGTHAAGGFFAHDGELGILVEDGAPEALVQAQIAAATAEAVRHLSRRYLN